MKKWMAAKVSLIAIVSSIIIGRPLLDKKKAPHMDELNVYVPFVFSEEIDPRSVFTVGDQMVSEHIFAYHNSASIKKIITPLFSDVKISHTTNVVEIELIRDVIDSTGYKLHFEQICESIKSSLTGTKHTKYNSLITNINCSGKKITIKMTTIPVNFEYWLRSTDFAICVLKNLPLKNFSPYPTTGPYSITSMTPAKVELKLNDYFPPDLTSNRVKRVNLTSYSAGKVESLLEIEDLHLSYMYGYSIREELIAKFKEKGFKIQIFPNEWLVYLGFQKSMDFETRNIIASKIDSIRTLLSNKIFYGNMAYSTVPADRAYGLTREDYIKIKHPEIKNKPKRKLSLSTLDEWAKIPLFKYILDELKQEFDIEIKLFERKNIARIYSSNESDLYLSPMGISTADPLGNYSFFLTKMHLFESVLSNESITSLYEIKDFNTFSSRVKEIELELLKKRILVPIGHFPGIVIESEHLVRDEDKSWDWGIQAWTYKIN